MASREIKRFIHDFDQLDLLGKLPQSIDLLIDLWKDELTDCHFLSTTENLDFSLSSGGEGNDDEDLSFSDAPLDDEDDEPLTRPSSGFTPSPQPLTSTQKQQAQGEDRKPAEKKETGW